MSEADILRTRLKELEAAERKASDEKIKLATAAYKLLPLEVSCKRSMQQDWMSKENRDVIYVQIRKDVNAYASYVKQYGMHPDDNKWCGMQYYRTDEGILDSCHGGCCVLLTPKLCSDQEWSEIAAGRVPSKFKNQHWWCGQ